MNAVLAAPVQIKSMNSFPVSRNDLPDLPVIVLELLERGFPPVLEKQHIARRFKRSWRWVRRHHFNKKDFEERFKMPYSYFRWKKGFDMSIEKDREIFIYLTGVVGYWKKQNT